MEHSRGRIRKALKRADASMSRFSVIITCCNQRDFIKDAVEFVLAQAYPDKEIVVVDDGSADGSKEILEEYGDTIKLKALKTNQGPAAARNRGASLSEREFLVFLDGDDLLLPWALNVYSRIIDFKDPILILSSLRYFKGRFSSATIGNPPEEIKVVAYEAFMKKDRAYRASASTVVVARQSFNRVGGWTDNVSIEDIDFAIKLGYSGPTIQIVSPQTTAYRVHATNNSRQVRRMIGVDYQADPEEEEWGVPGRGELAVYKGEP